MRENESADKYWVRSRKCGHGRGSTAAAASGKEGRTRDWFEAAGKDRPA